VSNYAFPLQAIGAKGTITAVPFIILRVSETSHHQRRQKALRAMTKIFQEAN
jgi:hypothetical protein